MLRPHDSTENLDPPEPGSDEPLIRADERARVEEELRSLDEADRSVAPPVASDDEVLGQEETVLLATDEPIEVVRTRSFSFGQMITMLAGAALVVLGILALVKTGVETPLSEPVESVLGWNHTPLLGIIEIAAGALLVLLSLRPGGRWFVALVGLALLVGGVAVLAELDWVVDELGAEQDFGWVPIVVGLIALLASILTPRRYQRMTGIPVGR